MRRLKTSTSNHSAKPRCMAAVKGVGANQTGIVKRGGLLLRSWGCQTLVVIVLLLVLVVLGRTIDAWLSSYPIERVKVFSDFVYVEQGQLEAIIRDHVNTSLLQLDLAKIKALIEQDPWVETVVVARQWPDTLKVRVYERKPVARWGSHGLVSSQGVVFEAELVQGPDIPVLSGPEGSAQECMFYYERMSSLLRPLGLSIKSLDRGHRTWQMQLAGFTSLDLVTVTVDSARPLEKLKNLMQLYRYISPERQWVSALDLRYDNGVAVRWRSDRPEVQTLEGYAQL